MATWNLNLSLAGTGVPRVLQEVFSAALADFPWEVQVEDWSGHRWSVGRRMPHWRGLALRVLLHSEAAARAILRTDALGFLERYVAGEVDLDGNLYLLSAIRSHLRLDLTGWRCLLPLIANRAFLFQSKGRAQINVKSHYDLPQQVFDSYLDRVYRSYSCGLFAQPDRLVVDELVQPGAGPHDDFDSLEKAQWRKFKDAVDFLDPKPGDSLLDIGCGYGGQLRVALQSHPFGKVVGWTHSHNQATAGRSALADFGCERWELHEGDYRDEHRIFDHITSTGMVEHVGPRGLVPYVSNVRSRIRKGGRYLHHCMMEPYTGQPVDAAIGVAFNKKYVWPGFHYFTLAQHVDALETNGFDVMEVRNYSPHYAKTTASWYERMMANEETIRQAMGEQTFRAWRVYLAGAAGGFLDRQIHLYRVYCRAV